MSTSGICTFEGKVRQVRVVGTGRALLLDNETALKDGHTAWVQPIGALGNAKIDGPFNDERDINPINASDACEHYDATYKAADPNIEIEVVKGGANGAFVGKLADGRDCSDVCPFDWVGAKKLLVARADDTPAKLAGPIPHGDKEECPARDGAPPPLVGIDKIEVLGIEDGVLVCGDRRDPIAGDWDFLPGAARSLYLEKLEVRGHSLFLTAKAEYFAERSALPPIPWAYVIPGGAMLLICATAAWKWSRRAKSPKLTRELRRQLHDALLDAFRSREALQKMLRHGLDNNLNHIAGEGKALEDTVFQLLEDAESKGYTKKLVQAACKENPENEKLREVALEMGSS